MDHVKTLTEMNEQFIDAWRKGSWELIEPLLAPTFCYLDGTTGEVTEYDGYRKDLDGHPNPTIGIDQVVIRVNGNVGSVSARSFRGPDPERFKRYLDTYELRDGRWQCVHATVWPLP